jgi:hypothetical protein
MSEKKCPKCDTIKSLDQFPKSEKGTILSRCIACTKPPKHLSEEQLAKNRQSKKEKKEANDARRKVYLQENQERIRLSRREYYRKYYAANKEKLNQYQQDYRKTNTFVTIRNSLRKRLHAYITKNRSTTDYVGTSIEVIKEWLEFNFEEDMTWENYGTLWNIDHTIPCILFDMKDDAQIHLCFDWKNLMPKYVINNLKKRSKMLPYLVFFQETRVNAFIKQKQSEDLTIGVEAYFKEYRKLLKHHFDRPMPQSDV